MLVQYMLGPLISFIAFFEPYNPIGEYGLSKTQDKGYRSFTIGVNSWERRSLSQIGRAHV